LGIFEGWCSKKVFLWPGKRIVISWGRGVRWALGFKGFLFSWCEGGDPLFLYQDIFRGKRIGSGLYGLGKERPGGIVER
jgi:hypothetical protein